MSSVHLQEGLPYWRSLYIIPKNKSVFHMKHHTIILEVVEESAIWQMGWVDDVIKVQTQKI